MAIETVAALVSTLVSMRALGPAQRDELLNHLQKQYQQPQALARELLQRGWLTPYQVNQLFLGNAKSLELGGYILLERLGEGGMGEVYKARHLKLDRIVALKLIRRRLGRDPEAVRRFRREIEAAAQLSHPNIVLAFDADEIGGTHFYTMEYVEGTTLSDLVRRSGPLLVPMACEYVRQTALGLQHAHERGLVHRDIKPSNLMLTWTSVSADMLAGGAAEERARALWGTHTPLIKILDMGLVRHDHSDGEPTEDSGITQKGMVVGTPDFMAPEQALDNGRADIRSDLYSCGCTLYFLLSGQVPFPGGTKLDKMFHHTRDEPTPLRQLQPGVPAEVQAIVARLMAKKPDQRYQKPIEVAQALEVFLAMPEREAQAPTKLISRGR
jgi:serine/threonine-protein kinase